MHKDKLGKEINVGDKVVMSCANIDLYVKYVARLTEKSVGLSEDGEDSNGLYWRKGYQVLIIEKVADGL